MTDNGMDFGGAMKGIRSARQEKRTTSSPQGDREMVQLAVSPLVERFVAEDKDLWVASHSDRRVVIQYGPVRACWITVGKNVDEADTVQVTFHSDDDQKGQLVWLGNRSVDRIQESLHPWLLKWYQTLF